MPDLAPALPLNRAVHTLPVMKHPRVVPTRAQLERAFNRLRLTSWPATLDEALADHTTERLVHGLAVSIARQDLRQARVPLQLVRNPARPAALRNGRPQCALLSPAFDPKRLAANDRDD